MATANKWAIMALLYATIASLFACATLGPKLIKPTVSLVDVTPLNLNLSSQQLRFKLRVRNPNSFELPLETVNFVARFNDSDVASGKSYQSAVIPAHSAAEISIDVTAGIHQIAESLKGLLQGTDIAISYQVSGAIQIANWNRAFPFSVDGIVAIDEKLVLPKTQ